MWNLWPNAHFALNLKIYFWKFSLVNVNAVWFSTKSSDFWNHMLLLGVFIYCSQAKSFLVLREWGKRANYSHIAQQIVKLS
jgi:hypothetical protein